MSELRRRLTTPPEVQQLPDGSWLARRLGLAAIGSTDLRAVGHLMQKEFLHCSGRGARLDVDGLADHVDALFPKGGASDAGGACTAASPWGGA
jgi:hypothetical protein